MESEKIKRIQALMDAMDMSASAFAKCIGFNQSNFSKVMTGRREIPANLIESILDHTKVKRTWLLTGVGEMFSDEENETRPHIPSEAAAGSLVGFADAVTLHDCERRPVVRQFPSYDYTIVIKGDSMEPKYEGGDEIAIRRVMDFMEWGKVYVLNTRDGAVIKRIYDAGDNYRCVSYNEAYPDFLVPKESVVSVFRVVGLLRY